MSRYLKNNKMRIYVGYLKRENGRNQESKE
jgi:hypothetical protein